MLPKTKAPSELLAVCERWSQSFEKWKADHDRIEYIRSELPVLLQNRPLFFQILGNIVSGDTYPDIRQAQLFEDEIILHLNPRPLFSIRMFVYEPKAYTPIHDHNSWGVLGSALGKIGIVKYVRKDDGSIDGCARLQKSGYEILDLGKTDPTLPLDQGIHQTGNPIDHISIMVSVYGRPLRRAYIHRFDMDTNAVYRMYSPRVKKKMLAAEALQFFRN